jgi:hypothetical protein
VKRFDNGVIAVIGYEMDQVIVYNDTVDPSTSSGHKEASVPINWACKFGTIGAFRV